MASDKEAATHNAQAFVKPGVRLNAYEYKGRLNIRFDHQLTCRFATLCPFRKILQHPNPTCATNQSPEVQE